MTKRVLWSRLSRKSAKCRPTLGYSAAETEVCTARSEQHKDRSHIMATGMRMECVSEMCQQHGVQRSLQVHHKVQQHLKR